MSDNREIEVLRFDAVQIPKPIESQERSNEKFVWFGLDNLYPNYLLKLYGESPIHSSIINSKVNYIIGDGLQNSAGSIITINVNAADTIEDFLNKVVKDYLIYNFCCVEVLYSITTGRPIEYHFIPAHKVRTNKDKNKFWVSENWALNQKPIIFERWKPNAENFTSKIFFFDGYNPSVSNIYPTPDYHGSLKSIQTDIEIRNFNLNNIQNHFSVSSIITFFRGSNISEDIKKKIIHDLKASYTGATGKKMIVDFQDAGQSAADVKNISPNDWDKAYELIGKKVSDDIMIGHQVTSPMLFGVKTEGQLGGSIELETAYEIFSNTYIRNKRIELESALNYLFQDSALISDKVSFADRQLFSARISEQTKEKIYTINEMRKEAGLPPLADGDRLLTEIPRISESIKTPTDPATAPIPQSNFSFNKFHLTEEDFDKIKHLGITSEEFEFITEGESIKSKEDFNRVELKFENEQEIADYLLKNNVQGQSIQDIKAGLRKDLGISITISELKSTLKTLNDAGVMNVTINDNSVSVSPVAADAPKRTVQVMYSYEVRAGLGEPIIAKTRPFCKKLVQNNRLYTRQEIQTMASIFGYDIFSLGGGYYRDPETGDLTTHCRHEFVARTVSRRIN